MVSDSGRWDLCNVSRDDHSHTKRVVESTCIASRDIICVSINLPVITDLLSHYHKNSERVFNITVNSTYSVHAPPS